MHARTVTGSVECAFGVSGGMDPNIGATVGAQARLQKDGRKTLVCAQKRGVVNQAIMIRILAAWVIGVLASAELSVRAVHTLRDLPMP